VTTVLAGQLTPFELAHALGVHPPTPEQAEVIAADPAEPALVVAGAGSGKTETMAARVVWLVANGHVTPEAVLGLTFTRKAAQQLAERVRSRLRRLAGSDVLDMERRAQMLAGEPTVLTYHAYAGRLVAEHGLRLPADPGARLLTETGAWQLAHRVTSTWEPDLDLDKAPRTITGYLLGLAGQLAEHLRSPDELRGCTEALLAAVAAAPPTPRQRGPLLKELARYVGPQRDRLALLPLLERYTELKRRDGVLDFGDQMGIAARLAETHPEVGAAERARFGAVLLDEYQDTGHAQRVLLRALFGGGAALPVTAVGDPCQSIYGWRGASAANLPRFTTDFPRADGSPVATHSLLTSFRNPPEVLALANAVSARLRVEGVHVGELCARDGAPAGDVRCALLPDVRAEVAWVADGVAHRWHAAVPERSVPPTAAVLVRRRADMAPLATALRSRGVPVEVVGLGGLLDTPEVRDLVSVLRLLVDPLAGTAAVRLLTGARWRLGTADLAALWRRARALALGGNGLGAGAQPGAAAAEDVLAALPGELPGEQAEQAGLVDALDSLGAPDRYSVDGYIRLQRLGRELHALRRRVTQPLTDLVADAERTLLLDTESLARPGPAGRAHLDAFADVVADFAAANPSASLPALLDYLATAEDTEDGLEPGEVEVAPDRVQVLTVHAAKGLEWEVVAVPHLVTDVFPGRRLSASWVRTVTELPVELRGDLADLPTLVLPPGGNQKELAEAIAAHDAALEQRRLTEERRLLYVALTRSESVLLVSGHHWGERDATPRGPSEFLTELRDAEPGYTGERAGQGVVRPMVVGPMVVDRWADPPADGEVNPLGTSTRELPWPADPLGARRDGLEHGAHLVLDALSRRTDEPDSQDPEGWRAEIDVLLAERAARRGDERVALPAHLSVSQLVELAGDPGALAARLRRPVPVEPNPLARRGTAFHAWLERRFGSTRLLDVDELPGAADAGAAPDTELTALQNAFLASEWAARSPHDVEVPFETVIDGVGLRGRMDAVFAEPDGGWTVVDWKTGAVPDPAHLPAVGVQLAAYRLAWAELSGTPLERVRAAFHYVRHDHTLRPVDLLDADGLRDLLRTVPGT
jgi:DNA helicase-2/ATP-dependent DNA helicase PcrA